MDKIYRCMLNNGKIRVFLADTSKTCKQICEQHNLSITASDALSRVLSVGAIMGCMQKFGKLTLKIDANGPLKSIIVDANVVSDSENMDFNNEASCVNIRGLVANPFFDEVVKVEEAVGELGILSVVKDFGMKQNFTSQIELQTGKIGDDFSFYFKESEQVPSVVNVGTKITDKEFLAGALIIQLMPGYKEEDILYAETFAKQCPKIQDIIAVKDKEAALEELFPEIKIFSTCDVKFACTCSKQKFINGLATLKLEELEEIKQEGKDIELTCNFCGKKYQLTTKDIEKSIVIKKNSQKQKN